MHSITGVSFLAHAWRGRTTVHPPAQKKNWQNARLRGGHANPSWWRPCARPFSRKKRPLTVVKGYRLGSGQDTGYHPIGCPPPGDRMDAMCVIGTGWHADPLFSHTGDGGGTVRERERERETQAERKRGRQAERKRKRQRERQRERERERPTERDRERETDRERPTAIIWSWDNMEHQPRITSHQLDATVFLQGPRYTWGSGWEGHPCPN